MNRIEIVSQIPWMEREIQEARKRIEVNSASICATLRKQGVANVTANYCGAGDDGQIEEVIYISSDGGLVEVDEKTRVNVIPDAEKPTQVKSVSLGLGLDMLMSDGLVAGGRAGWENNCGGEGVMRLDVEKNTISMKHYERVETLSDPIFINFF